VPEKEYYSEQCIRGKVAHWVGEKTTHVGGRKITVGKGRLSLNIHQRGDQRRDSAKRVGGNFLRRRSAARGGYAFTPETITGEKGSEKKRGKEIYNVVSSLKGNCTRGVSVH